tara:strand:+ start:20108 stop:20578 length:471 start_codon:yes stop_codon:yes gene_type:complete
MKFQKNLFIIYVIINVIIISFININNNKKININFFTWQSNNISLGNLISYSYLAGISFNSLLILLIIKDDISNAKSNNEEEYLYKDETEDEIILNEENFTKPPERDIKESQPTISVNYRVIANNRYSKNRSETDTDVKNNGKSIFGDWEEKENDWS